MSTDVTPETASAPDGEGKPLGARRGRHPGRLGNRIFAGLSTGAGILILVTLAAVAIFLVREAMPAITASPEAYSDFTRGLNLGQYIAPLVFGTVLAALLALVVAVPLSIGIALFIAHYAPKRLSGPVAYVIDLLAAIPSVVYGLWGFFWLVPKIGPIMDWISERLGFIPIFADYAPPAKNITSAALVLAVMILPIITAVSREVFLQTPRLHIEASLALGATRWEVARQAILPFGRSGVVSASMLGLGRALGETMAVLMILAPFAKGTEIYSFKLFASAEHQTIAANIAQQIREAHGMSVSVLIASGLALFAITLVVNMAARAIVARRAAFSGAN
ncbi:phosphate ABC transporter permease subunit PstC [Litorihabitans aurantiacus]|uniref:Phosphate transport system permease protein n=1 Tax=Litorihabitans aurantiacus TaxID=1930061 RepID=A0AA37UGN0_9MICO|nr:phosphate ABC transporter permease subunit PstC [Litorihabitans aurantiacus]GMA30258.1 phosphate transport system permease protein [Litorihabitans aurantiacus]